MADILEGAQRVAVKAGMALLGLAGCSGGDGDSAAATTPFVSLDTPGTTASSSAGTTPAPEAAATPSTEQDAQLDVEGGLDGPVMYWRSEVAHLGEGVPSTIETALLVGALQLRDGCLLLTSGADEYPILWPFGSRWQSTPPAVVLPSGVALEIGGSVDAGGGYHGVDRLVGFTTNPDVIDRAGQCARDPSREIAVVQAVP